MSGDVDFHRLTGAQRKILRQTLVEAFRRAELDMLLDDHDLPSLEDVAAPGAFPNQVFYLLRYLESRGRLAELVAAATAERSGHREVAELGRRLSLAGPAVEEQRVVSSRGLERLVRASGFQDLNLWAGGLVEAGRQVCRIRYPVGGDFAYGTGFLLAADRALTNFHVVEPLLAGHARAADVVLSFGYSETDDGLAAGDAHRLADDWLGPHAPYSPADLVEDGGEPAAGDLDFAVVTLASAAGGAAPAAEPPRGWVDLAEAPEPPAPGAVVFILQHPTGDPLKLSVGLVQESPSSSRLRYDADTEPGSSGALVLDASLRPVALHHAGDPNSKIRARFNQGIPLARIQQTLAGGGPPGGETS